MLSSVIFNCIDAVADFVLNFTFHEMCETFNHCWTVLILACKPKWVSVGKRLSNLILIVKHRLDYENNLFIIITS